ncbi:MAG: hypothetical protein RR537_00960 [Longicatena sp.]
MNHKGSTLIEMVMAILIISIAGIMILGGFSATLRVMSNGNKIKNASDTMLSVAEKTNDTKVHDKVTNQTIKTSYEIKNLNNETNPVEVNVKINTISVKNNKDVNLKTVESYNKSKITVGETESYKKLMADTKKLMANVDAGDLECKRLNPLYNISPRNETVLKKYVYFEYYNEKGWDLFPKDLLPVDLKNNSEVQYLKPAFPWDYSINNKATHGDKFIYFSKGIAPDSGIYGGTTKDNYNLSIVFDPIDEIFYYYPKSNSNDKYILYFYSLDVKKTNIGINKDFYKTWSNKEFINYIKNQGKNDGWKVLDAEALYDIDDPDTMWKPLK